MLTSVGRAAARRVVTSSKVFTTTPITAPRAVLALRPATARSFTVSALDAEPAAAPKTPKAAATKKAPATKKPKKDAATKKAPAKAKKPAVKKKPVVKKAPKPKKVPTLEEKDLLKKKELKRLSLVKDEPKTLATTAWRQFAGDKLKDTRGFITPEIAEEYKNLSASDLNRLQAQCDAQKEQNEAAMKNFVESYPPERIYLANIARAQLDRLMKKNVKALPDARAPKRPRMSYNFFFAEQVKGQTITSVPETAKEVGQAWRALSDEEKQPYVDQAEAERQRYNREFGGMFEKIKLLRKELKAEGKTVVAK